MASWQHRLSNIDRTTMTADCAACGRRVELYRRTTEGREGSVMCAPGQRARTSRRRAPNGAAVTRADRLHLAHRTEACERCGYSPLFLSILHVHHRDGDHSNNARENLITLCPTCHAETHALTRVQERHAA